MVDRGEEVLVPRDRRASKKSGFRMWTNITFPDSRHVFGADIASGQDSAAACVFHVVVLCGDYEE